MNKITPFLWFDNNAEGALNLYLSTFKNAKVLDESRYGPGAPMPEGTLFTATIQLEGQNIMLMNAGPHYKLNEAFSLFVDCQSQAEVDTLWEKLTADGGEPGRCGWLKDKFGVSWQIIPSEMNQMMGDKDPQKAGRAMQAMFTMSKIDLAAMRKAFEGK